MTKTMAQFRPAGFSDEDSDSDYGFYEKPSRNYFNQPLQNPTKTVEVKLQEAIINADLDEVENIVTYDLKNSVNLKLDSGWTPLMHACFHAHDRIVDFLLERGADPNLHADSVTPIMAVCSNSSANNDIIYHIVCSLIERKCLLNVGDKYGQTPLMRAISSGRVAVVQKLLDEGVNIEMRDQQGWTAIFWAVHHNQPEILEILIAQKARLTELDKYSRTPLEIAMSHDHQNIIEILNKHVKKDDFEESQSSFSVNGHMRSWHDFYPGAGTEDTLTYVCEIPHLLYGMNCERLGNLIEASGMNLREFLLLEEDDMIKLGIDMPYERQRMKMGLKNFHLRGWKLNAVAGLYARKSENYSVLDCLTSLGTHMQQIYILEATLQYTLRDYNRNKDQIKFEPPDSPLISRMKSGTKKLVSNINSLRKEIKNMKDILVKISRENPQPADLILPARHSLRAHAADVLLMCAVAALAWHAKRWLRW